jgi:hypothetical protein
VRLLVIAIKQLIKQYSTIPTALLELSYYTTFMKTIGELSLCHRIA